MVQLQHGDNVSVRVRGECDPAVSPSVGRTCHEEYQLSTEPVSVSCSSATRQLSYPVLGSLSAFCILCLPRRLLSCAHFGVLSC